MTSWTRRLEILLLANLAAALIPAPAHGQRAIPAIEEMRVDLWPEYDRPSTLVMYRFRLKAGADLSLPVEVPIPASAGEPHAVAWRNPQSSLMLADFTRRVEGDRAMVSAQMGSVDGQLELYSNIAFDGPKRTFRFRWPGGVSVGSLSFQVQQPTGATSLKITPEPARQWVGEDGFTYARVDLGRQDPGSTPVIEVTYEKSSSALSAPDKPPAPPVEIPSASPSPPTTSAAVAAPASTSSPASLPPAWLYAIGGLLMGAGASWLVWSSRAPRSRAAGPDTSTRAAATKTRGLYCHQCGTREDPGATFCTECGARLVKPSG
jgi:hypothetical protein